MPGLIMMSVITNSYSKTLVNRVFFSTKFQRRLEELMVRPVSSAVILLGYNLWRCGPQGWRWVPVVTLNVAVLHPGLRSQHLGLYRGSWCFFTSLVFALGGFYHAVFARFERYRSIPKLCC